MDLVLLLCISETFHHYHPLGRREGEQSRNRQKVMNSFGKNNDIKKKNCNIRSTFKNEFDKYENYDENRIYSKNDDILVIMIIKRCTITKSKKLYQFAS